ncbi:hypothetical protein RI129_008413 [Pyrocoelia pectoralis]|uniref:Acyltransferase 3 domain-containing protein n=1 Tax=Pyrocoelia pectoralis TaxID=417401 RepID=A0AAN7ZKI5_9COLE
MPLYNPVLIVDIFFFLSGFLVSYMFLQKSARGYKFNFISHYLGRYLRLTPPVVVGIIFTYTWFECIGSGPLWNGSHENTNKCLTFWWTHIVYIQNWAPSLCQSTAWYLSVDFQLFILSPILLIPLKRWPKATLVATFCLILLSLLTTFLITWIMKIPVILYDYTPDYLYYYAFFLPTKAAPWLIGFMLGYIIFESQENHVPKRRLIIPLLAPAVIVIIACIFGMYRIYSLPGLPYNRLETSLCLTLIRPAIAISLGYVVYCCQLGYTDTINTFLSNPVFEVISRLSYTMYLVHEFAVEYNVSSIRIAPFVTNFTFLINDLPGLTFLTLLASLLLSLAVELPAQHFTNSLMKRIQEKSPLKS